VVVVSDITPTGLSDPRPVVLHIEDNVSNRKLVELIAAQCPGVKLVEAETGVGGIELARELRPALVLLDLRLPDISGEQVLHRLLADPRTAGVRLVLISAEARPVEAARLVAAGADGYLVKPVEVAQLRELFESVAAAANA
jgi:CheY-like chemotaxis protein